LIIQKKNKTTLKRQLSKLKELLVYFLLGGWRPTLTRQALDSQMIQPTA